MASEMTRKAKMVLVGAEEISFEGREGKVTKWKYTFVLPDGSFWTGYLDGNDLEEYVEDGVGEYSEKLAREFTQRGRVWDGKVTWKLAAVEPD